MKKQFLFILFSIMIGISGFYGSAYGGLRYIFESTWGDLGSAEGAFDNPNGVALSMVGTLYVSDMRNHRIQKFTKNGEYIMSWGSQGTGDAQFDHPGGLVVNPPVATLCSYPPTRFQPRLPAIGLCVTICIAGHSSPVLYTFAPKCFIQ